MPQWRAWEAGICPWVTARSAPFRLELRFEPPGMGI